MLSVIIPTEGLEQPAVATLAALVPGAAAGVVREVLLVDRSGSGVIERVADVAGCRPFRFGNIGMRLAMLANEAFRTDQDGCVVIKVRIRIDLGQTEDDLTGEFASEPFKAIGGWSRHRLDIRLDLFAIVPAIPRRPHLGRDDQAGTRRCRRPHQAQQPGDVALLFEHRGFELNSGRFIRDLGRHLDLRSLTPERIC